MVLADILFVVPLLHSPMRHLPFFLGVVSPTSRPRYFTRCSPFPRHGAQRGPFPLSGGGPFELLNLRGPRVIVSDPSTPRVAEALLPHCILNRAGPRAMPW